MRYIDSVSSISITTAGVLLHGAKTAALAAAAGRRLMLTLGEHCGSRWSFSPYFLRGLGRLANEVRGFGEADDDEEEEVVVEAEEDEVAEALKLYEDGGTGDNASISNRYSEYSTVVDRSASSSTHAKTASSGIFHVS